MRRPIFDAHFHIIDTRFPLVPNRGYVPPVFTVEDYRNRMRDFDVVGGAVVSGSFQELDQSYLIDALARLGKGFVGVTQLPASVPGSEIDALHASGIRAVRMEPEPRLRRVACRGKRYDEGLVGTSTATGS